MQLMAQSLTSFSSQTFHGSTIGRLTAFVFGQKGFVCKLQTTEFTLHTVTKTCDQRRISFFGARGYSKLVAHLEDLRRLMSYKVALHVLVTFTEQVVPVQKHIALF